MLTHPTLDQLNQLGLLGMASAFGDITDADTASLTHAEWLAPTYADAILDRLVHNATRLDLSGESMRRKRVSRQPSA